MPSFRTFEEYDQWNRKQQLKRLRKLQGPEAMNSIVGAAAAAGDAITKGAARSGLQDGSDQSVPQSAPEAVSATQAILSQVSIPSGELSRGMKRGIARQATQLSKSSGLSRQERQAVMEALREQMQSQTGASRSPSFKGGGSVQFISGDGATYLTRGGALTSQPASAPSLTISFWFDADWTTLGNANDYVLASDSSREISVNVNGNGDQISFRTESANGGSAMAGGTNTLLGALAPGPHHCMLSMTYDPSDLGQVWIDGVKGIIDDTGFTGINVGNQVEWAIAATALGGSILDVNVGIADVWMGYEDFAAAGPVGVFIDANGAPMDGGDDGAGYTGTQPAIYFKTLADFNTGNNRGFGGDFTKTGNLFTEGAEYSG